MKDRSRDPRTVPIFRRGATTVDTEFYYATNTDVLVFGTPQEYRHMSKILTGGATVRLPADERGGMDLLVLPPAVRPARKFMVIQERVVYQDGRFNMELIIGGSRKGLARLASRFTFAAKHLPREWGEHIHVDDFFEKDLLLPAVFLNIRAPVEDAQEWLPLWTSPSPHELPPYMNWREADPWPYEIPRYRDLYVRLPVK